MLLAGVSVVGAVLVLCKYLYFNIVFPSEVEQVEMNRLKLLYTHGISSANFRSQTQPWDINCHYAVQNLQHLPQLRICYSG
jgi:hypothetical protein